MTQEIRKLYSAFESTLGIYTSRSNIENKFTKAPEENMFKTQEAEMKKSFQGQIKNLIKEKVDNEQVKKYSP